MEEEDEPLFKSGWAVQYLKDQAEICIYTLGSKRTHYDFQPILKKIIEDAFDSKVRSWLNSLDYIEDEDEQERVKTLVVQEIRRFNRWLFSSDCDIKTAAAGIQSRYLLLGTGLSEPKLNVSVANEKDRAESQQALLQTYKDAVRDKLTFPSSYWEYPAFILLCILSHEGQKAFWASLTSDAPVKNSTSTMNAIEGLIHNKSVFDAKALARSLGVHPQKMLISKTSALKSEMATIDIVVRKFAGQNKAAIQQFLKTSLKDDIRSLVANKNSSHGGQQLGPLADDWKSYFYRLIFVYTDKKSKQNLANETIFNPESDFYSTPIPGFEAFCEAYVTSIVPADEMSWNFQSQLKAGVLKGPMQKSEPLTSAVSKDGKKLTGMDAIYDEYREEAEEPRKFRLGQDLLSMHDINPIASSFYEAARLEAYFRAKSSESRTYKKRRTEDAFSGYDEEFARVAHRQGMFRHPLIERQQEKQAVLSKAISMLILPSTPEEWYKNGNCFVKDKGAALEPEADIVYKVPTKYVDISTPARDEDSDASSEGGSDDEEDTTFQPSGDRNATTLSSNHVSEHLFQQEHAYALWSFDRGIKDVEEPSEEEFDWFLRAEVPPVPESFETPASKPKEYVLLPVTAGGLILSEVFVDTKKYWLVGDTFSLYSDALTLCLKFVNRFRNKDYAANAEYNEEEGGDEDDGQRGPREVLLSLQNDRDILRNDLFIAKNIATEKEAVSKFYRKVQRYEELRLGSVAIDVSHMNRTQMTQTKCSVLFAGAKQLGSAENSDFHFGIQHGTFRKDGTADTETVAMNVNLNDIGVITEVYVADWCSQSGPLHGPGRYYVTKAEGVAKLEEIDRGEVVLAKLNTGEIKQIKLSSDTTASLLWPAAQYLVVDVQIEHANLSKSGRSFTKLSNVDEEQFRNFNWRFPYYDAAAQGPINFKFLEGQPYKDDLLSSGTEKADPSILNVWDASSGKFEALAVTCVTKSDANTVQFLSDNDNDGVFDDPINDKTINFAPGSATIAFDNGTALDDSDAKLEFTRFPVRVVGGNGFQRILNQSEMKSPESSIKEIGKYATSSGVKTIEINSSGPELNFDHETPTPVHLENGLKFVVHFNSDGKVEKAEVIRPGYNNEEGAEIEVPGVQNTTFTVSELIDDNEANHIEYFYCRSVGKKEEEEEDEEEEE